ncbi:glutathione S-transferase 1-like [Diorhabda carinulata]|uniref:glutathione S-transferase 1-like n=1 Tax=Diorhabda carinulata TaxID=1163345 RepID=UPI0025A01F3B|nr:glutathione S-transferase 1-like [Diorhabda carinulata]
MAPTLYYILASPPVRSVLLCAKAIGVELNLKEVDVLNGEHLSPEYLKINPQHTVPVLDDDGFIVIDSHVIMTYLVSKYGKSDSLYPKDIKQRAIVDHRLHFDSSILFIRGLMISKAVIFEGAKNPQPKQLAALEEAFNITERFLDKNKFIAGDNLTVADFSFVTSLTSWTVFCPLDETKHPNIAAWLKRMKSLSYYAEANQKGLDLLFEIMNQKLIENNK